MKVFALVNKKGKVVGISEEKTLTKAQDDLLEQVFTFDELKGAVGFCKLADKVDPDGSLDNEALLKVTGWSVRPAKVVLA